MITDECISCGACEDECPNDAISLGEGVFVIDPDLCSECVGFYDSQKCAEACPIDCCVPEPSRRESKDTLLARARRIHAGRGLTLEVDR
jgi:ferredoxin